MNRVLETEIFRRSLEKLPKAEQEQVSKIREQLQYNLTIGKMLKFGWLREKKLKRRRILFTINLLTKKAALLTIASKKNQQEIIDHIIKNHREYKKATE